MAKAKLTRSFQLPRDLNGALARWSAATHQPMSHAIRSALASWPPLRSLLDEPSPSPPAQQPVSEHAA